MTGPGRGTARVVRGGVLAATCLALSLSAHAAAGGQVHLSPGLLLGGLLLTTLCVAAAQSRGGVVGITSTVLVSQVALHVLAGPSAHAGEPIALVPSAGMVVSHGVAALLVSVLLAGGDRLIWSLWRLGRLPRVPVLVALPIAAVPAPLPAAPGLVPVQLERAQPCLRRRGPPHS